MLLFPQLIKFVANTSHYPQTLEIRGTFYFGQIYHELLGLSSFNPDSDRNLLDPDEFGPYLHAIKNAIDRISSECKYLLISDLPANILNFVKNLINANADRKVYSFYIKYENDKDYSSWVPSPLPAPKIREEIGLTINPANFPEDTSKEEYYYYFDTKETKEVHIDIAPESSASEDLDSESTFNSTEGYSYHSDTEETIEVHVDIAPESSDPEDSDSENTFNSTVEFEDTLKRYEELIAIRKRELQKSRSQILENRFLLRHLRQEKQEKFEVPFDPDMSMNDIHALGMYHVITKNKSFSGRRDTASETFVTTNLFLRVPLTIRENADNLKADEYIANIPKIKTKADEYIEYITRIRSYEINLQQEENEYANLKLEYQSFKDKQAQAGLTPNNPAVNPSSLSCYNKNSFFSTPTNLDGQASAPCQHNSKHEKDVPGDTTQSYNNSVITPATT